MEWNVVEWSGWKGMAESREVWEELECGLGKNHKIVTTRHKLVRFGESG